MAAMTKGRRRGRAGNCSRVDTQGDGCLPADLEVDQGAPPHPNGSRTSNSECLSTTASIPWPAMHRSWSRGRCTPTGTSTTCITCPRWSNIIRPNGDRTSSGTISSRSSRPKTMTRTASPGSRRMRACATSCLSASITTAFACGRAATPSETPWIWGRNGT